ncbi:MAG TPA: oligopeptide/dipeptide ABC transporter ATP-binding protein [Ramlibacter sp.]|uniref:ABC transporter ATP-binding protein n=1 Tax=Ramlibacter sp. TaxID=1917967 RepID=UPI002CB44CC1|nr:oligopeptide/dipeptide ABC transporter ATP-binding protein [Ramlibacter sp.]HVZ46608.1 oligopeptide/dipeptide ABC transporter ATP-binding protein [Ramlibacter sp.]
MRAVDGVSFSIARGETLSLVGESGCGKSTVGRSVLGLLPVDGGEIHLDGVRIDTLTAGRMRAMRKRMQVIFQDPFSSLNPRLKVRDIIAEPITNFHPAVRAEEIERRVASLLEKVGLPRDAIGRWPHEFSGGQRQRIGIARALAANPELIVCDEAVSALDVSVKAQIVNLLQDLQRELDLSLLFISHDLGIVAHMTHRVAVMYLGRIVEIGTRDAIFLQSRHPYTQALLSAAPQVEPSAAKRPRVILRGEIPSAANPPSGCRFHTRCPHAFERCVKEEPQLRRVSSLHESACHLNDERPLQ